MQAVCILLWNDCFETYMVVTYPLDLSYHEKARKFQFWQYGTFNCKQCLICADFSPDSDETSFSPEKAILCIEDSYFSSMLELKNIFKNAFVS